MNRQSLKRQTPPTCHCEGASCPWQSREGTCSPYRPPSKRHAPIASVAALTAQPLAALPPYGCGVPLAGCERLAGWQSLRHAFCGARLSDLSLRGGRRPTWQSREGSCSSYKLSLKWHQPPNCHCEERSDVAISGRQLRFRRGFPVIHPGTARLPRPRWGLAMTAPEASCR